MQAALQHSVVTELSTRNISKILSKGTLVVQKKVFSGTLGAQDIFAIRGPNQQSIKGRKTKNGQSSGI